MLCPFEVPLFPVQAAPDVKQKAGSSELAFSFCVATNAYPLQTSSETNEVALFVVPSMPSF